MSVSETLSLCVNGKEVDIEIDPGATLLTVLRDDLRILSSKRGCNQGVCGSCTVLIDGVTQRSCLTLAATCEGKTVQSVDALNDDPKMIALQQKFMENGAVQCGFCTGGMLISAWNLLQEQSHPTDAEIKAGLSGNLCRCTGYKKIIESVAAVARGNES